MKEGNKLIALFMGKNIKGYPEDRLDAVFYYHKSYEWLMPVWVKFRDLKFDDLSQRIIHNNHCHAFCYAMCYLEHPVAYDFLVEGIKWYNEQVSSPGKDI